MNALIEAYGNDLNEAIDGAPEGHKFILSELMAEKWPEIRDEYGATRAGNLFVEAVEANVFPGVQFVGIRRNGRANEYIKVPA